MSKVQHTTDLAGEKTYLAETNKWIKLRGRRCASQVTNLKGGKSQPDMDSIMSYIKYNQIRS